MANFFFRLSDIAFDIGRERLRLPAQPEVGACVAFEGLVRNHHQGRAVRALRYEAHVDLAIRTGNELVQQIVAQHGLRAAACVHRTGALAIGDLAIWAAAWADHRDAAFAACRVLVDRVKAEVPIWKHEHYADGGSAWVGAQDL